MHPTRIVALGFVGAILLGTIFLMLPQASSSGEPAPLLTAFFTAVSAVCVTGLVIVDTGSYWSFAGQLVILLLFQLGGFGIMTAATLLGLMVNRSLRLKTRLIAQTETHTISGGDLRSTFKVVLLTTLIMEAIASAILVSVYLSRYDAPFTEAVWHGIFHAISAFNNAGFALYPDGLTRFGSDFLFLLPVMTAIVVGGLGFPVFLDLREKLTRKRSLSLHSKITLTGTASLLLLGTIFILALEWNNVKTLGTLHSSDKLLSSLFMSVSSRTAGFNTVDIGALERETWAIHYLLMFVGGGSAGTAGGVKVGTFFILLLLVWAEIRGRRDTEVFGRRVSNSVQREAITVLVLGSACVVLGTFILLTTTEFPTDQVIFEVISAFATVGLSTGITADLPPIAQVTLTVLMVVGRVGTITVAAALATSGMASRYRYPEERPIVG